MTSPTSPVRGVCPILDTPFDDDGEIDYAALETLIEHLAAGGCDAAALFGFASEYYTLTDRERRRMTEVVVDACDDHELPSVVSITPHATNVAVEAALRTEEVGADALMVLPPRTRVSSASNVLAHVEAVAGAVSLPVVVQYTPSGDGVAVGPDAFADLYDRVSNVAGFKIETEPPGPYITRLLDATDGDADVLVGNAGFEMIEAFDRGAVGVMPATSMYEIYVEINDRYRSDDRSGAIDLHGDLLQMLNLLSQVGIQYEKRILAERGLVESAHCRAPVESPDASHDDLFEELYPTYIEPHLS